jgi:hypothetical protein
MKKKFGYFIVVAALAIFLYSDAGVALAASAAAPAALQTPRMRRERRTIRRINHRERRLNRRERRIRYRLRNQRNRRWRRNHRVG